MMGDSLTVGCDALEVGTVSPFPPQDGTGMGQQGQTGWCVSINMEVFVVPWIVAQTWVDGRPWVDGSVQWLVGCVRNTLTHLCDPGIQQPVFQTRLSQVYRQAACHRHFG